MSKLQNIFIKNANNVTIIYSYHLERMSMFSEANESNLSEFTSKLLFA